MLHKNAAVGDIHPIVNWVVADAAAKTALVVTVADLYKVAYQQDDGGFYFLVDESPVTWVRANTASVERVIIPIAVSDEATALTIGVGKVTFRNPYGAFTLTAVRGSLSTAQTSGTIFTVDVNVGGASILSTKLTVDNTEKTSTTAAAPSVISSAAIADDAEISIDIDQIGDGTAKGLKIYLIGHV